MLQCYSFRICMANNSLLCFLFWYKLIHLRIGISQQSIHYLFALGNWNQILMCLHRPPLITLYDSRQLDISVITSEIGIMYHSTKQSCAFEFCGKVLFSLCCWFQAESLCSTNSLGVTIDSFYPARSAGILAKDRMSPSEQQLIGLCQNSAESPGWLSTRLLIVTVQYGKYWE